MSSKSGWEKWEDHLQYSLSHAREFKQATINVADTIHTCIKFWQYNEEHYGMKPTVADILEMAKMIIKENDKEERK